jgi:hypothetical protein
MRTDPSVTMPPSTQSTVTVRVWPGSRSICCSDLYGVSQWCDCGSTGRPAPAVGLTVATISRETDSPGARSPTAHVSTLPAIEQPGLLLT